MISIHQNMTELEKFHQLRAAAVECYRYAITTMAQYAVELDNAITPPHRKYLSELAAEMADPSEEVLSSSRGTLRGLLRDYRDRAANYIGGLRDQLSSTALALQEMVSALSQSDTDHTVKLRSALVRLRAVAKSAESGAVRAVLASATDSIEQSLEQIRKQHQFTISQFQTEVRLLHARIDSLETAATLDEATRFSNRRFVAEYLHAMPAGNALFVVLKLRGLAEARARFSNPVAEDLLATFGRRLRNAVPRETVVGRWSEQEFLAIVPAKTAAATAVSPERIAEHLSMPYACMIGGKVVRIPLVVTAEAFTGPPGATTEQIEARVAAALEGP